MLKAVRFDEDVHKHLLEFIDWYTDKNGKKNESEAIRFLMQKGYEAVEAEKTFTRVNAEPVAETTEIPQQPLIDIQNLKKELADELIELVNSQQTTTPIQIDVESLKKDLLNDVLQKVNMQTFDSINTLVEKLSNFQPVIVQQPTAIVSDSAENKTMETKKPKVVKKPVEIPADTNPLLANMLSNANK
jgi:NTP pyrophosphatase (non-canonical NTP hydrolase)